MKRPQQWREHLYKEVGLSGIATHPNRLRVLRPEVVDAIASSFREIGQQQPIVLRPAESDGYWLVAGKHRLEAARKLKWDSISALILDDLSADEALLREIDENLARADLSPAETALHIDARKAVYERAHPETKHGATGRAGRKNRSQNEIYNDYEPTAAFIDDTAKKTNKGRATVARDAKRGKEGKAWLGEIVGTSLDGKSEIDALINLSEDNRNELIEKARAGKKVSAKGQLKKQKRAEREAGLAGKIAALPEGKFGVVVEDFEWDHETWSEAGKDRHASNHYPTSRDAHTAEEIVERTKDRFACAADDCVLFMWTTATHLAIAIDVLRMRGFDYKSTVIWGK